MKIKKIYQDRFLAESVQKFLWIVMLIVDELFIGSFCLESFRFL